METEPGEQPTGLRARALVIASLFVAPRSPLDYLRASALPSGGHRARVVATRSECEDTATLTLRPAPRTWSAGQHVDLSVLVDGAYQTRTFSISSAPPAAPGRARTFDVTIRAAAHGRVTPMLVRDAKVSDDVRVSAPAGGFVLPDAGAGIGAPLLFVTAGSGVTPVMSMLRAARDRGSLPSDVVHLHFERTRDRIIFDTELDALAKAHPSYRRTCELTGADVNVDQMLARIRAVCPDLDVRQTFACGPAPLLDAMRALYNELAIEDRLHTESFGAPLAALSSLPGDTDPTAGARLSFTRSQVQVDADGRTSLLVLAERAGLKPAHGCRRGLCHSCEAPLRKGTIRDLRTGMTTVGSGRCVQLCISAPVTNVEIDL